MKKLVEKRFDSRLYFLSVLLNLMEEIVPFDEEYERLFNELQDYVDSKLLVNGDIVDSYVVEVIETEC